MTIPDPIKCILAEDREAGVWVGRCLDFDIVTSGKTIEIAWKNLKSVVKLHIEHCFTNDHVGMNRHTASDADFKEFDNGVEKEHFRSDNIKLNLVTPKEAAPKAFWIRGVELGFQKARRHVPAVH